MDDTIFYIALTDDQKINSSRSTRHMQVSLSGPTYITDEFYNRWAQYLRTTVQKLKDHDDACFTEGNCNPIGCFAIESKMHIALCDTDPRPYDDTVGGIRLYLAEPAPGAKINIGRDDTVPYDIILCSGVRIISEVPRQEYIDFLRSNWPGYFLEP